MKKFTKLALISAALIATTSANAHTTSLGYVPGVVPGDVTFWTGSYEHGGSVGNEGTFSLQGITNPLYQSMVGANVAPTTVKPTGLINGTNNFFWNQVSGGYTFPNGVDPILFGGVKYWQGITFSGLAAGTYSFTCGSTCGSTQQWATLTNGAVQITLTASDVSGAIPEPATWMMMLMGFGLIGAAMRRKRQNVKVSFG